MVCELQYSGAAAAFLGAAALATIAVIAFTPGPASWRIVLATFVACAALEAIHAQALRRGPRAASALAAHGRAIQVRDGNGRWCAGEIRVGSFVAPWLTIVRWRPAGGRWDRTVLILPGMAAPEALRRLRVLLRWA